MVSTVDAWSQGSLTNWHSPSSNDVLVQEQVRIYRWIDLLSVSIDAMPIRRI